MSTAEMIETDTRGHDWFKWHHLTCCKTCGIVRRRDGANKPCRGKVLIAFRKEELNV